MDNHSRSSFKALTFHAKRGLKRRSGLRSGLDLPERASAQARESLDKVLPAGPVQRSVVLPEQAAETAAAAIARAMEAQAEWPKGELDHAANDDDQGVVGPHSEDQENDAARDGHVPYQASDQAREAVGKTPPPVTSVRSVALPEQAAEAAAAAIVRTDWLTGPRWDQPQHGAAPEFGPVELPVESQGPRGGTPALAFQDLLLEHWAGSAVGPSTSYMPERLAGALPFAEGGDPLGVPRVVVPVL